MPVLRLGAPKAQAALRETGRNSPAASVLSGNPEAQGPECQAAQPPGLAQEGKAIHLEILGAANGLVPEARRSVM